jgi:hypothetical protein
LVTSHPHPQDRASVTSIDTALLALVIAQSVMLGVLLRLYLQAKRLREQAARRAGGAATPAVELEARRRWEALDLTRLHELNREEVEKLLTKVRGTGVRSLTAAERAFLDRITQALRPS